MPREAAILSMVLPLGQAHLGGVRHSSQDRLPVEAVYSPLGYHGNRRQRCSEEELHTLHLRHNLALARPSLLHRSVEERWARPKAHRSNRHNMILVVGRLEVDSYLEVDNLGKLAGAHQEVGSHQEVDSHQELDNLGSRLVVDTLRVADMLLGERAEGTQEAS